MKVLIGVDPHKASVAVAAVDEAKGELLAPVSLFLLSQHHSTARPSAKRYDNRYEGEDPVRTSENPQNANFALHDCCELRGDGVLGSSRVGASPNTNSRIVYR
jgi:hypothetical protein